MSRTRAYHKDTLDAISRYFETFSKLQEQGEITINRYCTENEIDRRHWYVQREDHSRGFFEIQWITSLAKYNVNTNYILFGTGSMFK